MSKDDADVRTQFAEVLRTPLHRHPGVLEIVVVLRGTLDVRVSCERFALVEGDYAVLNAGDPHQLTGSSDNVTGLLHLRLAAFDEDIPGLNGVIFACESFDLARYRGTENSLRTRLLDIFGTSGQQQWSASRRVLQDLADGYAFEDYYERQRLLTSARRHQFRFVLSEMRHQLAEKDVLRQIAQTLHYQKGSVSRIVREASAVSFSDLLTFMRVAQAEIELLETDETMVQLAESCGFSDVKYLTRAFRAWFGESPADYRRGQRPELEARERVTVVPELGAELLAVHRRAVFNRERMPRLSITPLLVKNLGGRADLFRSIAALGQEHNVIQSAELPTSPHLLPVRVTTGDLGPLGWLDLVKGIDRRRFRPVLILPASDAETASAVITEMFSLSGPAPDYWLAYEAGAELAAERLATSLGAEHGVIVTPMLVG
ncbi:MAG: AraC family transcriptional regulator [Leucobacter sp.]